jgi:tRNA dimethylallyltransferase
MPENQLLVITGPTATGKTAIAAHVSASLNGEIISADSRQVYRGMDIGTGKDLDEYMVDGRSVDYHLIDIVDPGFEYNVYEFNRDFRTVYSEVKSRGRLPILCGGTGMYIDSVVRGYELKSVPEDPSLRESLKDRSLEELAGILSGLKPDLHNISDITDRERALRAIEIEEYYRRNPDYSNPISFGKLYVFGIRFERKTLKERISHRLESRLEGGMVDEVRELLGKGVPPGKLLFYGLEYRYITEFLLGQISYDEMVERLRIAIYQFSKRQMTWFRRMERQGVRIHWIDGTLPLGEKADLIVRSWGAGSIEC